MRAFTILELVVSCAMLAILALVAFLPRYAEYARARQVDDAATVLSQDVAYLERFAQNSEPYEGATIEVSSVDPLAYTCYSGRPSRIDPQSHIRDVLFSRSFPDVELEKGALGPQTPFLFAHNGSIQYAQHGEWADQHVPVTIELRSLEDQTRTASIAVDPFTGAVTTL